MVLSVVVLGLARTSFAVVGSTVTIGSDSVPAGESTSVPLDVTGAVDLGATTIDVVFDNTVVNPTTCHADPNGDFDITLCNINFAPDTVRVTLLSTAGVDGNSRLADITFAAIGTQGEVSPLTLNVQTYADSDGAPSAYDDTDGTITLTGLSLVWGDANCSGSANPVDSLIILRYAAGLSANTGDCLGLGETVDVLGASPHLWGDVDCSGAITPVDSLKLLRADAGLPAAQKTNCPAIGSTVLATELIGP